MQKFTSVRYALVSLPSPLGLLLNSAFVVPSTEKNYQQCRSNSCAAHDAPLKTRGVRVRGTATEKSEHAERQGEAAAADVGRGWFGARARRRGLRGDAAGQPATRTRRGTEASPRLARRLSSRITPAPAPSPVARGYDASSHHQTVVVVLRETCLRRYSAAETARLCNGDEAVDRHSNT